jgi:hypothetical protein
MISSLEAGPARPAPKRSVLPRTPWLRRFQELPAGALEETFAPEGETSSESVEHAYAVASYVQLRWRHWATADRASLVYWIVQLGAVGLSLTTPLLVLFSGYPNLVKAVPAAIGASLAGINGLADFRGLSRARRNAAFRLDSEFRRYQQNLRPYDGTEARKLFAENIEAINRQAENYTFLGSGGGRAPAADSQDRERG